MSEEISPPSFDIVVVEREPAALALVSTDAAEVVRRIPLQPHPRAAAVRADGRFAYVAHDGPDPETEMGPPSRLISVVELATGKVFGQDLGRMSRPCDLAFDAEGRLHALVGEPATLLCGTKPNAGQYEIGMALPDGDFVRVLPRRGGLDALLLDAAGDRVVAHGMQEHRGLRRPLPLPVVPRPYCMDLSPDGRHLVVGGRERAELTVLDAESFVWEPPLSLSAPPVDLAFAPDGTLHVATADGTLWRGDAARLEAAGAADIRAFVRGRPEWALTADALIRADADARVAGLQRPVTACARSA